MRVAPVTWLLLGSRLASFLVLHLVATAALAAAGEREPFVGAARWWLVNATAANVVTLVALRRVRAGEGGVRRLWRFSRETWKGDVGWLLGATLLAGPAGFFPNQLLSSALWGDPNAGNARTFLSLSPGVLLVVAVVFPVSQALAELPLYFGHVLEKLKAAGVPAVGAVLATAAALSVQHVALPLHLEWRYLVWRGLMFLPFAVITGALVHKRPTVLPYLLVVHGLMDAQLPLLTWFVTTGALDFSR